MLVIACYLFYLQKRFTFNLISFIIDKIINQRSNSQKDLTIIIFTIIITIIILPTILDVSYMGNQAMLAATFNFGLLILPLKFILGTIEPFHGLNFYIRTNTSVCLSITDCCREH